MAAVFCSSLLLLTFSPGFIAQDVGTSILFIPPSSCGPHQFFNSASLQCDACGPHQSQSANGLHCVCQAGLTIEDTGSPLVHCHVCDGTVSQDQRRCLHCAAGKSNCFCGPHQTLGENMVNLTAECYTCPSTTVATSAVAMCALCQDTFYAVSRTCNCPDEQMRGGLCFNDTRTSNVQGSVPLASVWFSVYLDSSFLACTIYNNLTACQLLVNFVTLDPAGDNGKASQLYSKAASQVPPLPYLPPLFYSTDPALQGQDFVPNSLTFYRNTQMNLKVIKFDARGIFQGWADVRGGTLQLCPDTLERLNAAYFFGTTYHQSCSVPVQQLLYSVPEPIFYELFLLFRDSEGQDKAWPVPVRILNTGSSHAGVGRDVRRFFLVDGLTGRVNSLSEQPQFVRYLSRLTLSVHLPISHEGAIPPFQLEAEYDTVSTSSNPHAQMKFSVTYSMNEETSQRQTTISAGVLGVMSFLLAGLETSSWSQRAAREHMNLMTLLKFFAFFAGNLANTFFLVTFGTGVYWLIVFKGQYKTVNNILPSAGGIVEKDFIIYVTLAFVFKVLQLTHMLLVQVSISIFLIDWEKSKCTAGPTGVVGSTSGQGLSVSAWRTFFVANKWNEIQTLRKLNPLLQLFLVLLILKVIGVENIASRDLRLTLRHEYTAYSAPWCLILRYAINVSIWLASGLAQVLFFLIIYERFVEDKVRHFMDLCAMTNISVFILKHRAYGFYIHGRSVHGHADVNLEAMHVNLRREAENLCTLRGLEPNSDTQTFEFTLSEKARQQLERMALPLSKATQMKRLPGRPENVQDITFKAYRNTTKFLTSFLQHGFRDMDYIVKDKLLSEKLLNYEFQQPVERSIFYKDPDGTVFSRILYYNNELNLLLFDTLLFCIVDLGSQDLVLAAVVTYAVRQAFDTLRYYIARRNLSIKTLVDPCFLI